MRAERLGIGIGEAYERFEVTPALVLRQDSLVLPTPPYELQRRVGGVVGPEYDAWGRVAKADLLELLPWSLAGRRVLDFGCGAGRILRHLGEAQLAGCDIDAPSIEWVLANMPWVDAFLVEDAIPRSAASYDLVLAASVFTHLLDWEWWMLEIRRVLVAGGFLLATFVGPGMYAEFGEPDGMAVLNPGQSWDLGAPYWCTNPGGSVSTGVACSTLSSCTTQALPTLTIAREAAELYCCGTRSAA